VLVWNDNDPETCLTAASVWPPYPTVLLVKLLLLQPLYTLSGDALEYQVLDHTSFQRFLGLEHSGRVPDAKTVWVWRERLKQHDLIGDIVPEDGDRGQARAEGRGRALDQEAWQVVLRL
jgi:hypothetical protein